MPLISPRSPERVFIHYLLVTLDSYVEGEIVGLGVSVGSVINLCLASSLLYQKQKAKKRPLYSCGIDLGR
jgi:hypothetical protein